MAKKRIGGRVAYVRKDGTYKGMDSVGIVPPNLNKDLIRRANNASTFFDTGDITQREYERNAEEIMGMSMSDDDKKTALNSLHKMTTEQLKQEAKAVDIYAAGPAVRVTGSEKASEASTQKRGSIIAFMENLRKEEKKRKKSVEAKTLTDALANALNSGALEFTFNGKTYRRKNKRQKSFTRE